MTFEVEQKLDESSQYTVETKLLEYKPEPKKMLELYSSGPSPETLRILSELMATGVWGGGGGGGAALEYGVGVSKIILVSATTSAAVSRAQQMEWDNRVEVEARRIFTEALALIHDKENWCVDTERRRVFVGPKVAGFKGTYKKMPAYAALNTDFANQAKRMKKQIKTVYDLNYLNVGPEAGEKLQYCSMGAIKEAAGYYESGGIGDGNRYGEHCSRVAVSKVCNVLYSTMGSSIPHFNDTHTHAEVIAAWEDAGRTVGWV